MPDKRKTSRRSLADKTAIVDKAQPPQIFNAAKTLMYAKDIEERIDGRSLLASGLASHRERLLALFDARSLDDLDGLEREAVRRLVKRRVVRELAWSRVQAEFEAQDLTAYNAEVLRFDAAVLGEERSEARLEALLQRHRERLDKQVDIVSTLAEMAREDAQGGANE